MSKRSPQLLLEDILDSANKILDYTNGLSYEQFLDDRFVIIFLPSYIRILFLIFD
jgi:uncharacterized protein with HEPN domain